MCGNTDGVETVALWRNFARSAQDAITVNLPYFHDFEGVTNEYQTTD